jgi:hypothetical protein
MRDDPLDLEALLHPARAYARPKDVVNDPDLTLYEKRAVLASWASDACAADAAPALRQLPGGTAPVQFDDVMDALAELDRLAARQAAAASPISPASGRDFRDPLGSEPDHRPRP